MVMVDASKILQVQLETNMYNLSHVTARAQITINR
jgi:hypothetical protein